MPVKFRLCEDFTIYHPCVVRLSNTHLKNTKFHKNQPFLLDKW